MNVRLISRYIGIALVFEALFMFLSVGVSVAAGFDSSFSPLLISAVITAIVGSFPLIFVRQSGDINLREGFAITVFSWILTCIFGMLPYLLWGGEFSLMNAWFESVSGFTTTGSTILTDVEALPKGLLFWRSSSHFIGGIGVVIFMLMVLPSTSTLRMRMFRIEVSALSKENYKFRTRQAVRVIGMVYIGLTVLNTICLMLAGMDFFDSVNHAFSIVATGGMSTRNLSILYYDSPAIELVCIVFMVLAGMHFGLLYTTVAYRNLKIFRSPVIRFYLGSLLAGTLLIAANLLWSGSADGWWEALRLSAFQVTSLASTTGLANADTSVWPLFSILLLMYFSIQCGCSGSTCGGIKVDRIWIFIQSFRVQVKKLMHPNAVLPIKVGNHVLEDDFVARVNVFIILYAIGILAGALLLSLTGLDLMDSLSASVASIGNVGPGFGTCGSMDNFAHFSPFAKFVLALQMLFGRLEIFALLLTFLIFKKNG